MWSWSQREGGEEEAKEYVPSYGPFPKLELWREARCSIPGH